MHGVIREYQADPAAIEDIARRVEAEFLPVITGLSGFRSYTVAQVGETQFLTFSVFESDEQARGTTQVAADWVKANMATLVGAPTRVTDGTLAIREAPETHPLQYVIVRRYDIAAEAIPGVIERVRAGLLAQILASPGFARYAILTPDAGGIISLSGFDSQEAAEACASLVRNWLGEHLSDVAFALTESIGGRVLVTRLRDAAAPASS